MQRNTDGKTGESADEKPVTMRTTVFEIREYESEYAVTQPESDADVTGRGSTPGRAIADYCATVEGWGDEHDE
jgi:hypothetical protein